MMSQKEISAAEDLLFYRNYDKISLKASWEARFLEARVGFPGPAVV